MNLIPELSVSAGRTATAIIAIYAARPAATKGYCTHPKVYGVRGLANAQILAEAPTSGFCNSGSSTEVTRTARWYRSCLDSDAGVADRPFGHESGRQSNHSRLSLLAGALLPLMIVLGLSLLPLPAAARRPQAPPPPPPPPPATTMRAYDFYSKFGVNTNLNAGQSVASIEQDLTYIGIYNIRDSVWGGADYPQASSYAPLLSYFSSRGINLRLHLGYQGGPSARSYPMSSWLSELKSAIVTPYPNAVVGVAGPNEPDNQGFTYTDGTGGPLGWQGIVGANNAQAALYAGVKADPVLRNIPVDMWPQAFSYSGNDAGYWANIGDQTAHCDRNNIHDYYAADNYNQPTYPTNGDIQVALQRYLINSRQYCNRAGFVTTETGWYTPTQAGWAGAGANEYVQARLLLNDLFDHAMLPDNKLVYIFDLRWGTADFSDPGWGVIHDDGTPKVSGTAIRNLMAILRDTGVDAATFTPGSVSYSLTGMPAASGHFVVAKSDGAFDVILWNETPIWKNSTATQLTIPTSTAIVNLPAGSSGSVYNPLQGTAPITTFSNVNQLQVHLNDSPLIIEVQ